MDTYVLALDQGTTSSRAMVFNKQGRAVGEAHAEFPQILPGRGVVEHDPEDIWNSQLQVARQALTAAKIEPGQVAGIGITNQRETTILWERATGKPIANAIVWQSRVTAPICDRLKAEGLEPLVREKTGLVIDAYFSGTKIKHLLDQVQGARAKAERGEILFGTVDTWLMWRLSGGKLHITDYSNASRTMIFNIHTLDWDDELLAALDIPRAMLPQVVPNSQVYGETIPEIFGSPVKLCGAAGDQQAATFGQCCFTEGSAKNTYGTGCFLLMNTGPAPVASENQLITTIGWQLDGQLTYCLEGGVFIAGAVVQWLRDGLGVIKTSEDVERLAGEVEDSGGVFLVPGFVGLGAPYWDPYACGAIFGIDRGTKAGHIARAAVESMAYQSLELIECMQKDSKLKLSELKVDGGASVNNALLQFQADLLDANVVRPQVAETTALGAAYLAGLAVGYWDDLKQVEANWALDRRFEPKMGDDERQAHCAQWRNAVQRTLGWRSPQ